MAIYYGKNSFYDSNVSSIPEGSIELTDEQHQELLSAQYKGATLSINNGAVIAEDYQGNIIDLDKMTDSSNYAAPVQLKEQATSALSTARTYVYNNYGILNEDTPDDWVIYIKALMLISNGKDTTSTTLPTQPTQ